jgi:hypothetical protein
MELYIVLLLIPLPSCSTNAALQQSDLEASSTRDALSIVDTSSQHKVITETSVSELKKSILPSFVHNT